MAVSPSGALGIVSTYSMRLISFDTLTGEIVNDQPLVSENRTAIYYSSEIGKLTYGSGNKLVFEDVAIGPIISAIEVSKKQTTIRGTNFLFGAQVSIDGEDLALSTAIPTIPGAH